MHSTSSFLLKILFCFITAIFAFSPAKSQVDTATTISFTSSKYNFKTHRKGSNMEHTFKFTNTGKVPLLIRDVKTSCNCTVPDWSDEPIAPGQSGTIDITYDSTKPGKFKRYLTVHSNAGTTKLYIKGKVVE
jgi:plastocyanin